MIVFGHLEDLFHRRGIGKAVPPEEDHRHFFVFEHQRFGWRFHDVHGEYVTFLATERIGDRLHRYWGSDWEMLVYRIEKKKLF